MDENFEYMTEMKSKSEYRLEKFKKNHDYNPKDGTIQLGNTRVKFKYTGGKTNVPMDAKLQLAMYNDGETVPEESTLHMDKATFNAKHPNTPEFVANHELGHLGAKRVKYENPKAYEKATAKYKGYINNLAKKGKRLNEHDSDPEEYIADDVGRNKTSDKDAKIAMKDLKRAIEKQKLGTKPPSKKDIAEYEDACKTHAELLKMMDQMLSDPMYAFKWGKIKADRDELVQTMKEYSASMVPKSTFIKNVNGIDARLKAIKANAKEDMKKNLPNAKFKYDRGKYKLVNPKK